jgi:hypothetical protein
MKILLTCSWNAPEYLNDGLLHGLRSIFGNDVVDYPRLWHMYSDSFGIGKRSLTSIAARGFTYYGFMEDSTVDRTDLENKIRVGYFDLIIMHAWYPSTLWPVIVEYTPKNKIVILDGRDETMILDPYIGCGKYFKRELVSDRSDVFPISFSFPKEKIQAPLDKIRGLSPLVPGDMSTYIYDTESEYYQQYNESYFGITAKKSGWDCLRHYEIIGSQCVPYFVDLMFCPPRTCTTLPKQELLKINHLINVYGIDEIFTKYCDYYNSVSDKIQQHFSRNCTTIALATYVLDEMRKIN